MRTKMAKRSTRTTPPRSQANFKSAPASPVPATELPSDGSAPMDDSADRAPMAQDDADDQTRAVSMASEPPERSTTEPDEAPDEEQVRHRAYHRFLERGGDHGYDVND